MNPVPRGRDMGPRIPPRERRVMPYDRPGHFYSHHPHYFGYRVSYLPPSYHHMYHWGRDYYFYNGIYYRPWGSYYVVCRPPFGVLFDWALEDAALTALRFSYYNNVYRTYDVIDDNYQTIKEQNLVIAQNNATIAAQNQQIAAGSVRSDESYALATKLGLIQSFADASVEYYYEDGVFFTKGSNGQYVTIVPPAGAQVSSLPDDYETFTFEGVEYYKVDDTVFRLVVINASPVFEVLGQLAGEKAAKYDVYK